MGENESTFWRDAAVTIVFVAVIVAMWGYLAHVHSSAAEKGEPVYIEREGFHAMLDDADICSDVDGDVSSNDESSGPMKRLANQTAEFSLYFMPVLNQAYQEAQQERRLYMALNCQTDDSPSENQAD